MPDGGMAYSSDRHETADARPSRPARPELALAAALLDGLGVPALIVGVSGELHHESAAFRALVEREPAAHGARRAAVDWVRGMRPPLQPQGLRVERDGPPAAAELRVRPADFAVELHLRRVPLDGAPAIAVAVVLVAVQPCGSCLDDVLRQRHALSSREVAVARLLADGCSAVQAAERLGISVHTVRRHTERVYQKLGVRSRIAVAKRLRELERGGMAS